MAKKIIWICLIAALVAALGYFLMGAGVIRAGDPALVDAASSTDAPWGFDWIAGGFYVIAGLALLLRKRWVFIALSIINLIPIVVFYFMWAGRPDILWSAPGLITKIAQVLLEAGLVFLLVKSRRRTGATGALV
jgi:hypothetical protein